MKREKPKVTDAWALYETHGQQHWTIRLYGDENARRVIRIVQAGGQGDALYARCKYLQHQVMVGDGVKPKKKGRKVAFREIDLDADPSLASLKVKS